MPAELLVAALPLVRKHLGSRHVSRPREPPQRRRLALVDALGEEEGVDAQEQGAPHGGGVALVAVTGGNRGDWNGQV